MIIITIQLLKQNVMYQLCTATMLEVMIHKRHDNDKHDIDKVDTPNLNTQMYPKIYRNKLLQREGTWIAPTNTRPTPFTRSTVTNTTVI